MAKKKAIDTTKADELLKEAEERSIATRSGV